ncbi:gliding motility-associated C-terminal domain-containing protein [Flavobacterium pectinovorum]|uniref:Gliding motility-associated C-terminal domain-containing protein n=1 Tax=Flavobacterium pectinovorum TaxID=29533 RepID=A0A502EQA4_9FLAO|nr:gliding motility-associated C-terminal domain-containing protein [Flavobacterium pectinovorum]TPG38371.1 gliding motility-associated C-terminal domain-containing protein [Flavobacterium pectinovorum]
MIKFYIKASIIAIFFSGKLCAQIVNIGDLSIAPNTQFATLLDFNNKPTGDLLNDGNLIVYANFNNDGLVTYSAPSAGKTFFIGAQQQLIAGTEIAHFQNILFDNTTSLVPFHLATAIDIGNKAEFKNGIIDAAGYNGKMIFDEKAFHSNVSNLSFVDGKVQKKGREMFEFPVGDKLFFRPSYHGMGSDNNNIYTTQYLFENAGSSYPYTSKDDTILSIDEMEYWNVTQDQASEKIVLSLTLDTNTTPASFFEEDVEKELAIVRWDNTTSKWINEKGVVSDPLPGGNYTKLITAQVSGYGLFTIGIVKKTIIVDSDLIIYNSLSPNGDGKNDSFHIKGIDKYPDNRVEIYNRWGIKVFDVNSYNESDVMFKGYSEGRETINKGKGLPAGTYFYILKYNTGSKTIEKSGYLYLSQQ